MNDHPKHNPRLRQTVIVAVCVLAVLLFLYLLLRDRPGSANDYLDDSADLVGCPATDQPAIAALGGTSVGQVDGVALISVPRRAPQVTEAADARVPGTAFNAVASIGCRGPGLPPSGQCQAGVVRRADRSADVTLLMDNGKGRTLSFDAEGQARNPGARSAMK